MQTFRNYPLPSIAKDPSSKDLVVNFTGRLNATSSFGFSATLTSLATLVSSPPGCFADNQEEILRPAVGFKVRLTGFIVVRVLRVAGRPATLLPR